MRLIINLFSILLLSATALLADTESKVDDKSKEILKKASKAMNIDSLKEIKSLVQKANISIVNMGMKGQVTVTLKDDKIRIESQTANINEVNGYDGQKAWSENITTGLRMLEGAEKLNLVAETLPYTFSPEKFYDSIEYVSKVKFNDVECHKIKFSKKGLDPVVEYYSADTFMLLGEDRVIPNPMGKMKSTTFYNDYVKHKSGFKYPASMVQMMGPVKVEVKVTEIKLNTKIDDKIFSVPAQ